MGSVVPDPGSRELAFKVGLLDERDADETAEPRFVVKLYREVVGDGEVTTDPEAESPVLASGEEHTFLVAHEDGVRELFYVQVDQEGSKDDAWTAPIYLEPSPEDGDVPPADPPGGGR